MMRRTWLSVLLGVAAVVAAGCGSSGHSGLPALSVPAPGDSIVTLENTACSVSSDAKGRKRVVIDGPNFAGGYPKEVTWTRTRSDRNARFSVDPRESDPSLFPGLPGSFAPGKLKRKSGIPQHDPAWNHDSDGDGQNDSYLFLYAVKHTGTFGQTCDPEICIRKSGNGCSG